MNAKVVVYLLISAFVLSGCTSFKAKLQEEKEAQNAQFNAHQAEREKFVAESKARRAEYEERSKELDKAVEQYNKTHSEFLTWYDSLSVEQKAIFNHELEEKQIRYNQIHGFNPDGSSRYLNTEGDYWVDRLKMMDHYKTLWDH